MKLWFYAEGDSECYLIKWLIRKNFPNVVLHPNLIKFVEEDPSRDICYIHNCEGVNKVPFEVSEKNHWVERSGAKNIFIVCDVEAEFNCPVERRETILDIMQKHKETYSPPVDEKKLNFIFCNPSIEEIYCFHSDITKNVLAKLYKGKFKEELANIDSSVLIGMNKSPVFKIKSFFRLHRLTYKETEFAENFFSQLDYTLSENKTIKRLLVMLNKVFFSLIS